MIQHKVVDVFNKSGSNRIINYFWKNKTLNSFSILGGSPKIDVSEVEGYRTDSIAELEALLFWQMNLW